MKVLLKILKILLRKNYFNGISRKIKYNKLIITLNGSFFKLFLINIKYIINIKIKSI